MTHLLFDTEIIGNSKPIFLICTEVIETGETGTFWLHKRGDMKRFEALLSKHTLVGFNSENFDRPMVAAALAGMPAYDLKSLAETIIDDNLRSWQTYREYNIPFLEYDHIDLMEVSPGVMTSLKTFAGRMSYPTMVDMPFDHDTDLKPSQYKIVESYCRNDIGVTKALYHALSAELDLRREMSAEYDIDLRSKSDAQIAEAILKSKCGITNKEKTVPATVRYTTPKLISTKDARILEIIKLLEAHHFRLNHGSGQPEVPEFLKEPVALGSGTYQMGVGGLHSTHDKALYLEASDELLLSDFDVASYYPNLMMKAGLIPHIGGKGKKFLEEYTTIYNRRMEAKRASQQIEKRIKEIKERLK